MCSWTTHTTESSKCKERISNSTKNSKTSNSKTSLYSNSYKPPTIWAAHRNWTVHFSWTSATWLKRAGISPSSLKMCTSRMLGICRMPRPYLSRSIQSITCWMRRKITCRIRSFPKGSSLLRRNIRKKLRKSSSITRRSLVSWGKSMKIINHKTAVQGKRTASTLIA